MSRTALQVADGSEAASVEHPGRSSVLVAFNVCGNPATKGSTRSVWRGRRPATFNACKREGDWAEAVRWEALAIWRPRSPVDGQLRVELEFRMPRPRRGEGAPNVGRCDLDKLVRSVLDALTSALWRDDRQVVQLEAGKRYAHPGEEPGVCITVKEPEEIFQSTTRGEGHEETN